MKSNNVLIIGSRAGGMFLSFSLKKNIDKYYLGKGESFSNLTDHIDLCIRHTRDIKVHKIGNINKAVPDKPVTNKYDYVFLAIREPHLEKTLNQYRNIIKQANYLFLTQNTEKSRRFTKHFLETVNPEVKVFRLIISNGIEYLSPQTIFVYGRFLPLSLIIEEENLPVWPKIASEVLKVFDSSKMEVLKDKDKIKKFMHVRHLKTLLSVFSLRYKSNLYTLFHNPKMKEKIRKTFIELSNIMKIDISIEEITKKIFRDNEVLSYYPSYFKNRFLRFKKDREWKYFYRELELLAKENGVLLAKQKNLMAVFRDLEKMKL